LWHFFLRSYNDTEFESIENYARNKYKEAPSTQHDVTKEKNSNTHYRHDTLNKHNQIKGNHGPTDRSTISLTEQKLADGSTQSANSATNKKNNNERDPSVQRFNFASAECGAKVLRSNVEAKVCGAFKTCLLASKELKSCIGSRSYII